jgi:hypothetical protein
MALVTALGGVVNQLHIVLLVCPVCASACVLLPVQLDEQLAKTRSAQKRKLSELAKQLEAKLVETDRKVAKITAKAGKANEVSGVLQHFMQHAG